MLTVISEIEVIEMSEMTVDNESSPVSSELCSECPSHQQWSVVEEVEINVCMTRLPLISMHRHYMTVVTRY